MCIRDRFQATNIKTVDREKEHGYNADGSDEKVYEQTVAEASDEGFGERLADDYHDMKGHPKAGPHIKRAMKAYEDGDMEAASEHQSKAYKAAGTNEETVVEASFEDRLQAARDKAKAAGKTIKSKKPEEKKTRVVQGKSYGGSKQDSEKEDVSESKTAEALYKQHHARVKDLLKKISTGVDAHKANCMKGNCHYGHVGDVKELANTLQDLHDRVHMQGEYATPLAVREDIELVDEMAISSTKNSKGQKVEWHSIGEKHMIHVDGNQAHEGFLNRGDAAKLYAKLKEEFGQLEEKKLTPAEMKKREEVAKAIERENPNMPMGKKMAIATATAKKVAEEKQPRTLRQILEAMVTIHVKPHPEKKDQHVVVKSSDSSRFKKGESVATTELEQGQDDGYLKVKHVKE